MFGSFFRRFTPRQFAFLGAFSMMRLMPFLATSEENERINKKLKRKLNERYHNREDISFELTEEFRYSCPHPGRTWSSSQATPTRPFLRK